MQVTELEQTYRNIEIDLDHMHLLFSHLPVPTILYDLADNISWCSKSMLNLNWGVGKPATFYRNNRDYFGKHITDVMPAELAEYVQKQNARVRKTQRSQYEAWRGSDPAGVDWQVLRFPCGSHHLGVILFPKKQSHLALCDDALLSKDD
jgi:hypothetical protein